MRLGAHVSTAGGIARAVDRGVDLGCASIQIFPQSPRVWKPAEHPAESLAEFRERNGSAGLDVFLHAPYLVNLAGTDSTTTRRSVAVLEAAATIANGVGGHVVVHLGSHRGEGFADGLARVARVIGPVLDALGDSTWLLLENTAGAGDTMGVSVAELEAMLAVADHPRLGICLDTAHLYASGVDVGDRAAVDALIGEVERRIGLGRLRALHVNDSATPLGSRRDRHANLGEGELGNRMATFLGEPRLKGLPAMLETLGHEGHGPDAQCMRELRRLWRLGLRRRRARA